MKNKLWVGFLIVLICFCVVFFKYVYDDAKETSIKELNRKQKSFAIQARIGIQDFFKHWTNLLVSLTQVPAIANLDETGKKYISFIYDINKGDITAVTRVDAKGKIIFTAPFNPKAMGQDISGQKHVQEIVKFHKPTVSDVFKSVQGFDMVALHVPVLKNGTYQGTLAVGINFQNLAKRYLESIRIGETGYAWMISRDGKELFCPVPGHTGKSVFESCKDYPDIIAMAEEMMKGKQGITTYTFNQIRDRKVEPLRKHAVYMPVHIGQTFWSIVVASSENEVLSSLAHFKNKLVLIVGLFLAGGAIFSFFGLRGWFIVREEQKRKQAEEKLRESEEKYRQLFDNAPSAIYQVNFRTGKLVKANDVFCEYFGCSQKEIPSMSPYDIVTEESKKSFFERLNKMVLGEEVPENPEYEVIKRDGKRVWVKLTSKYIYDSEGLAGANVVVHDIDDLKRAEERIREYSEGLERMVEERTGELNRALFDSQEARDRIDGILKSVADGLIVTDLRNRVILMNRAAEDLLGVRLSNVIDRSIDYAIKDETLRERIRGTLEKRTPGYEFDFELPGEDDAHLRIMRARTSVIEDKDGKHTGIITIIYDVTYERELDRMKTEFLSTAAHELRSPLTSIEGFSELLMSRDDITEDERARFLSHINRQSRNLAGIISDLLDISRIESGRGFALNKVPSDIKRIAKSAAAYFESVLTVHRFDMTFPGEPVQLMIDSDKMEQVMGNIFSNAVKYSPAGGVITVTGEVSGDHYQVSIEDEGIGMTPEQVEKIFDKFYRVDASNASVSGTGLGMSIVKYIIEAHCGTVSVESDLGKGTTVRFTIPL